MCLFQRVIIRYRNLHTYNQSLFALISFTLQNAVYPSLCSVASVMSNLCDPMDGSPPGSSIHEILQARVLKSVAISFSSVLAWRNPRDRGAWRGYSPGGSQRLRYDRAMNGNSSSRRSTRSACSQMHPRVLGHPVLAFISVFPMTNDADRTFMYSFAIHMSPLMNDLLPSAALSFSFSEWSYFR